jgi:thymidylate synthase (FAD)
MTISPLALPYRVPVLDRGYVELQDLMPHPATGVSPDTAIAAAARVSFMGESKGEEKDRKLIHFLLKHDHTSPFEMVEYKLRIHAPLLVYWQWVRHRTFHYQSVNSQSGRYVEFAEDEFYVPAVWRGQSANNKQASAGQLDPDTSAALTRDLANHYGHAFALYERALEDGVAREIARLFLPGFAVYYTWIVKVDLLNLLRFLQLRMEQTAQYEIRAYAKAIWHNMLKPTAPITAEAVAQYWFDEKIDLSIETFSQQNIEETEG